MKKFLLPQVVLDVIKFTVAPASARVVTLDGLAAPCGAVVDWGDGDFSPLATTSALSHTYANTTPRQITIRGTLGGFWNTPDSAGKTLVTSLDEISSRSLITLQRTFLGCTSLATVPPSLLMPNIKNLIATFKDCRSITSELTPLWMTHNAIPHTNCYANCFKSLYGRHGTGCPHRQYVSAVPQQTYYQKYGQSGCPAAGYVPGTAAQSYFRYYGSNGNCPNFKEKSVIVPGGYGYFCSAGSTHLDHATCSCPGHDNSLWGKDNCGVLYFHGSPAYYACSHFGGTCKTSSCTRIYQSGQSAYYRCTRSGGTCQATSCPYPYANETSYNNARNNGWA